MINKLIINGYDAWETWGVFLEDGSYEKLLTGENMKPYTENKSRKSDGKTVSMKNPRLEDRDVTLVFGIVKRVAPFLVTLKTFLGTLQKGKEIEGNHYPLEVEVVELGNTYKLIYLGSLQLSQTGLTIGKVAVKFNEPNPRDR